jgi:hypothetical protein
MAIRFTLGRGTTAVHFDRAIPHTAKWDEQKKGLRMHLGMPAHGHAK